MVAPHLRTSGLTGGHHCVSRVLRSSKRHGCCGAASNTDEYGRIRRNAAAVQGHKDAYARKVLWGLMEAAASCDASRCLAKRHLEEGERRRRADLEALQQDRARQAEREATAREEREAAAREEARHAKAAEAVHLLPLSPASHSSAAVVLRPLAPPTCRAPARPGYLKQHRPAAQQQPTACTGHLISSEPAQGTMG